MRKSTEMKKFSICYKKNNKIIRSSDGQPQLGILMMIIASLSFSIMAILVKSLKHLPLMELVFFRSIPTFLFLIIIIKQKKLPIFGNNKLLLFFRSFFGFITMLGFVFTFAKMNLTDAMAIRQLSPLFVILLSSIFLHEKIDSKKIFIFILVSLGALLVIKPGFRYEMLPVTVGIISAFSSASAHTILRGLRKTDHPLVIVYLFAMFSTIISLVILIFQNNFYIPNKVEVLFLIFLSLISFLAQISLSYSYRLTSANVGSLYLYSRVLFTAILDFIIFDEIPDYLSILGCILIILGGYVHFLSSKGKVYS